MAKPQTNTAVTVPQGTNLPSFIKTGVATGTERLTSDDLKTPFLRLSQDKTPAVEQGLMKAGMFYNSVTGKVYGDSVTVMPILVGRGRMMFEEFNKGGAMLCVSHNGVKAEEQNGITEDKKPTSDCHSCAYAKWGEDTPDCNEQGNYLMLVPGETFPAKLVLQRSSFATHRKLATALQVAANEASAPIWAFKVKLFANKNKAGTLIIDAQMAGPIRAEDEASYHLAEQLYDRMNASFFKTTAGSETLSNDN